MLQGERHQMFVSEIIRMFRSFRTAAIDSPQRAMQRYFAHEQQLRNDFFLRASSQGKPRGLRWVKCDWLNEQQLLKEKSTGLITLLVGINLHFEAIEGGDMEDVEAVGNVRDASAVFHYKQGRWGTGGRVLFNMHPQAAAVRLADSYQRLEVDSVTG